MIWGIPDIILEIIAFLDIREISSIKLVNKFLLDITTKYIQNNTKKIFKKTISKFLPSKISSYKAPNGKLFIKLNKRIKADTIPRVNVKYFSPEIIYISKFYLSEKILDNLEKYRETLLIIIIRSGLSKRKTYNIDITPNKLQFLYTNHVKIKFDNLPSIKYISGNIDISNLNSLETFRYYPGYSSKYISKYINISYICTSEFTKRIIEITNLYPNINKLVIDVYIDNGYKIIDNIYFPNIIKLTIYTIVGYCTNKSVLMFKVMFPNAKIKIIDVFLNKTRRF